MASLRNHAIAILRLHGARNIAAALRRNARDGTRPLILLGVTAHEPDIPAPYRGPGVARDAVDRQVPGLLGDVVKRAEGVGREQTDVAGWARLLDARLSTRDQLPAAVSVPLTSSSKCCSCRSAVPGTDTSMAVTGSRGSPASSTPNCNAATPRGSHAGVPRGIANDRMTVEVEMAGRIDGIADAAG